MRKYESCQKCVDGDCDGTTIYGRDANGTDVESDCNCSCHWMTLEDADVMHGDEKYCERLDK